MDATALRMGRQQGQHPKEPIAAEKRRHTDIQPRIETTRRNSLKYIRPLRGIRMVLQQIFTTKVDYKLPYVYYA